MRGHCFGADPYYLAQVAKLIGAIAKHECEIELYKNIPTNEYDAVIIVVAHDKINDIDIIKVTNGNRLVYEGSAE